MIIGICDDSATDRNNVRQTCLEVMKKYPIDYEIIEFTDGEDIFKCSKTLDLLILDIEMPNISGIEVKQRLQKIDRATMIIFVTSHDELAISAFGIHVYGFVVKKLWKEQLPDLVSSAVEILNQFVMIDADIDSRRIVYIKSERVYSRVVMSDASERILRISLGELETQLLSVGFIRVHKTYLVNPQWIKNIKDREIVTEIAKIPISVRLRGEVKQKYREYCEKNARYC